MCVQPIRAQQLAVRANRVYAAPVHDDDAIRVANGCQPMRDHQRRATAREPFERGGNLALAFRIERARRFVEQQNRTVSQNGARNGYALALSARELDAALAQIRVEALRQPLDELERVGCGARLAYRRCCCAGTPEADVLRHARGEYDRILGHEPDRAAKIVRIAMADVGTVQQDAARERVVEAQDQREQRGFSRARWPDQRDPLPRADGKRDRPERGDLGTRGISEDHAVEANTARDARWKLDSRIGRRQLGLRVEQLHQPLGRARRALDLAPDFRHRPGTACDDGSVKHECRKLAGRDSSGKHVVAADPKNHADCAEPDEHDERNEPRLDADAMHARGERGIRCLPEELACALLVDVSLHRADLVQ